VTFGLMDVHVWRGGSPALVDVTVEVRPGSITALVGADGAGKTTAARALAGLLSVDRGRVDRPPSAELGYQPETGGTWDDLTVDENMAFVARAYRSVDPDRREDLIAITGLAPARRRQAGRLSGGMRQKLAVCMAMLARPRLLVLDEPTTGLDPVSRADLWRLLARSTREGAAVLVTTSYLDEAERAGSVVVLDEGSVLASGTPSSIRSAFPGHLTVEDARPDPTEQAWRRGRRWHRWWPEGAVPPGSERVEPDLGDVVIAAALSRKAAAAE
jgi:ABC-2 type transport system ATP-binding protein